MSAGKRATPETGEQLETLIPNWFEGNPEGANEEWATRYIELERRLAEAEERAKLLRQFAEAASVKSHEAGTRAAAKIALGQGVGCIVDEMKKSADEQAELAALRRENKQLKEDLNAARQKNAR